jgi:heme/copper-type cytochrome/quinol oxidase subunit 2
MSSAFADAIFWIAVACCSIAQLAILRSAVVSPAQRSSVAGGAATSGARRAAEIAWAVIPGIALAIVLLLTWRAMHVVHISFPVNGPAT